MKTHYLAAAFAITAAFGQSNLGSIQGTVVGSDGTPLSGARVYAAIRAANQKTKAPPTLVSSVVNGATAYSAVPVLPHPGASAGAPVASTFTIGKLPAGAYILCAQAAVSGWLDPCHWSAVLPTLNLSAGQNLTGQIVVMTKGAVVQVQINDPSKLLSSHPGPIPQDVEVIARASNNGYYNARIAPANPSTRTLLLTLPFDLPHTLIVRSKQLALVDSNGAAVPAAGHSQSLQVGVSQYQLSVGSSPGASDIYSLHTFPAGTLTATVPNLPTAGQTVYVSLKSMIEGGIVSDPTGPQGCPTGGGSGDDTPPTVGRTPGTAYVLNSSQYGQTANGEAYYTYTLDQGDASYLLSCFPSNPNDPLVVQITNIVLPTLSGGETHQFQVGYTALDYVTPGNHGVNCWWQGPDSDGELDTFPLVDSNGNGVVVYDATPVITSTNDPNIISGDQSYTTQLVITGHNFGASPGQLIFCSSQNSGCTSSDPNISYIPRCSGCFWSDEQIVVGLGATLSASGSYSVAIGSSTGASGNGFLGSGGAGSQASSVPYVSAFLAVQASFQMTQNGSQFTPNPNGPCAHIGPTPAMPDLAMTLNPATGNNMTWTMSVSFARNNTAGTVDNQTILSQVVPMGTPWHPYSMGYHPPSTNPFLTFFQGGAATVYWYMGAATTPNGSASFCIDGMNPTPAAVNQSVGAISTHWAIPKVISLESGYLQFCGSPLSGSCSHNKRVAGQPNQAWDTNGFGIMQLTVPSATADQVWNWSDNVAAGVNLFVSDLNSGGTFWAQQLQLYDAAVQAGNPDAVAPPDDTEGSLPCVFSWFAPYSQTLGTSAYPFSDPISIKKYNGISSPPGSGLPPNYITWTSGGWVLSTQSSVFLKYKPNGGMYANYVAEVCSQAATW